MSMRMLNFRDIFSKNSKGLMSKIATWWCKTPLFELLIDNPYHYLTSFIKSVLIEIKLYLKPSLTHLFILL